MSKTATIRVRIEPHLKAKVERILKNLGINTAQAITMYYKQIMIHRGLPFSATLPNAATLQVFKNTDAGKFSVRSKNVYGMFRKLGI